MAGILAANGIVRSVAYSIRSPIGPGRLRFRLETDFLKAGVGQAKSLSRQPIGSAITRDYGRAGKNSRNVG